MTFHDPFKSNIYKAKKDYRGFSLKVLNEIFRVEILVESVDTWKDGIEFMNFQKDQMMTFTLCTISFVWGNCEGELGLYTL